MAAILDRVPDVRVGRVDLTGITKQTVKECLEDDILGLAGQMSYAAFLAIFPFLIALAGVTSIVNTVFNVPDLSQQIVNKAAPVMPPDAQSVLRSFTDSLVASNGGWLAITLGLGGALWAASSAVGTAMQGLDRAYRVEDHRPFVRKRVLAIGITIAFVAMILVATLLLGSGRWLAGGLGDLFGWSAAVSLLWNVFAPLLSVVLVLAAVALLYWAGPAAHIPFRWVSPGALLFVVAWIAFSVGFALYLSNFANYNKVYGPLAAVVVLLVYLYWTNALLLAGGVLNAVLMRRNAPEQLPPRTPEPRVEPS